MLTLLLCAIALPMSAHDAMAAPKKSNECSSAIVANRPDPFRFEDQNDVDPKTVISSNAVKLTNGSPCADKVTWVATCGPGCLAIAVNGVWGNKSANIKPGDTIAIRQLSSKNKNAASTALVTVAGTVSHPWKLKTGEGQVTCNPIPDAFGFSDQNNVAVNATVSSNLVTLTSGTVCPPNANIKPWTATCGPGCLAIARNGVWGGTTVEGFKSGDTISVTQKAAASAGTSTTATVIVGTTASTPWKVTTAQPVVGADGCALGPGKPGPNQLYASIQVLDRPAYVRCWDRCSGSFGYDYCPAGYYGVGGDTISGYPRSSYCHSGICTSWVADWPITFLTPKP